MEEVFRDVHDELNSWLSFIDLICNIMLTQAENTPGNRGRVGFKPKPDKVLLLCGQSCQKDSFQNDHNNEGNGTELHKIFVSLLEKGKNSQEGSSSSLWNLFRSKLLDDCERLAFIVALSADLNRKYEQIYDVLSGDTSGSGRPTIGLIMDMCRLVFPNEECETTKLFDDSTIFRNLLVNKRSYAGSLMGEEISLSDEVELSQLVSKYNLRPGQIEKALLCAKELYPGNDNDVIVTIGRDILEEQIRNLTGEKLLLLSNRLKTPFGLEDIQLRKEARNQVEQLLNRIKHRSIVNDIYGFSQKLPYGRGVSAVLYGPPGTGKTMLASVIAHELGLDLYRVDTSAIGSKYIGETEKNMEALFEAASGSNGVLFFDEADALFAKRTDVESSNDKHANSEVAFLLQKIEEYDGLSILATNAVQNFDAAFKRRMTYFISVDKPDKDERLEIWKKVFPKDTPLASDVNFDLYSRVDGMTGSTIKSAAVTAAYYAASKGTDVTNADIIEAIDLEYKKAGNMMGIKESLYSSIL